MEIEVEPNWNPHFLKNRTELHGNSIIIADPIAFGGIRQYIYSQCWTLNKSSVVVNKPRNARYDLQTSWPVSELPLLCVRVLWARSVQKKWKFKKDIKKRKLHCVLREYELRATALCLRDMDLPSLRLIEATVNFCFIALQFVMCHEVRTSEIYSPQWKCQSRASCRLIF